MHVDADAGQPPRHRALEIVPAGEISGMRATIAQGHAEPLRSADNDVRAPFARWRQQRQCQQVGRHAECGCVAVGQIGQRAQLVYGAGARRILGEHTKVVAAGHQFGRHADTHVDAQRCRACVDHLDRLRMAVASHDEHLALVLDAAPRQCHRLGCGSGFIEHRGVGNRHAGEVADHGLEVDQRFQPPLRNFRLVGCVGGIPGRVFQHVAQDHAGCMGAVIPLADEIAEQQIPLGDRAHLGQCGSLGDGRRNGHRG